MPNPSTLNVTFHSDFSQFGSGATGPKQWSTTLPHGLRTIAGTGEKEYYADATAGSNPFTLSGTELDITASRAANPAGLPYTSGVITTLGSFAQLYGYFEMTAQLPAGQGNWPAFWLLPKALSGTQEIDVMEQFGTTPDGYSLAVHSPSAGIAGTEVAASDLFSSFHRYGGYWTPTTISYFFDGQQVAVTATPADMNRPMFMIANLAITQYAPQTADFSSTLRIAEINAYAYDPAQPGPQSPITIHLPNSVSAVANQRQAVSGVAVDDTNVNAKGPFFVEISTKTLGLLSVSAPNGVTVTGNDSWFVKISGAEDLVNQTLATLAYRNQQTSPTTATSDTITVEARDELGDFTSSRVAVAISGSAAPAFKTFDASPQRALATGNTVFNFTAGAIADPHTNNGQVDHIVNFHLDTTLTSHDFLAFHRFGATAQLVFDHLAAPNGVANPSMQYYRVDTAAGSSPIFLVQMAGANAAHLTSENFGFYPT